MNKLRRMSVFAHIVEEGSVSAAALKLELSKSVVSQHLKALELELGLTLIKRTTRRQQLTPAGESFYQSCRDINTIAHLAWEQAVHSQIEPTGRIRITAPNVLMEGFVTPVIAKIMKRYPKLNPELISDDQPLNLMEKDIDLAVRVGHSADSNLKQKRVGEFRDVLCVAAEKADQDIQVLPYIANHWQGRNIKHAFESKTSSNVMHYATQANCIANSFNSCLSLIKSGAGIGLIPEFYLPKIEPKVVPIFPDMALPENPVYVLTPFMNKTPLAVQICITELEKQLRRK